MKWIDMDEWAEVDEAILLPIQILNRKGYFTEFCCSAHAFPSYNYAFGEGLYGGESYILFREGVTLPLLPNDYFVVDLEGERLLIRSHKIEPSGGYEVMREILDLMEQLHAWALGLPEVERETCQEGETVQ